MEDIKFEFKINARKLKTVGIIGGIVLGTAILSGSIVYISMKKGTEKPTQNTESSSGVSAENKDSKKTGIVAKSSTTTAAKSTTTKSATQAPAGGGSGNDAKLSQLLSSSAWCSFSYNQYSGSSSTTRYVFSGKGTFSTSGQAESYNSGANGSVAGQSNSGGGGKWKIQGERLYIASADTGWGFVDINASLSQNSNGYPIITADGTEFTQCK